MKKSRNKTIVVVFNVHRIVDTAADAEPEFNSNMGESRFC